MRKTLVAAGVLVAAAITIRRIGPKVGERLMAKCEQMFDRMPEDFPPKRMMRGIEEIRVQNAEILRQLQQQHSLSAAS
jgi:hypothetical protein